MKKLALILLSTFLLVYFYQKTNTPQELLVEKDIEENLEIQEVQTKKSHSIKKPLALTNRPTPFKNKKDKSKRKFTKPVSNQQEDEKFHLINPDGSLPVYQVYIDGDLIIGHGDIIVGHKSQLDQLKNGELVPKLNKPKIWPKAVIPYTLESSLSNKNLILEAIKYISLKTPVQFVPRFDQKNYVAIKNGEQKCYSNLGMIGGEQTIVLAAQCDKQAIIHELMHTMGFLHEQNREDRDDYVEVYWEYIVEGQELQFKIIKNDFFDATQFPFDFESIMLYSSNSFSIDQESFTMTKVNGEPFYNSPKTLLSKFDLDKINLLYKEESEKRD